MRTRKNSYYHDTSDFFLLTNEAIFEKAALLYKQGCSLSEISRQIKISKTKIRGLLIEGKVVMRSKLPDSLVQRWRQKGKQGSAAPYGFSYQNGKVVRDTVEFNNVILINQLRLSGKTIHQIVQILNAKGFLSRTKKKWSWAAMRNIVERLEKGLINWP